ncbi:MAG: hypothetical protein ABI912_04240 [Actinomycetota bacterium]
MELTSGWCSRCDVVVDFDRPVCDEHVDGCPELACLLCGAAYFGADVFYVAAISTMPASAVATPAA